MSEGKKFLAVDIQELDPEKRIALLEAKLPVLIERIQAYDKIIEEFRSIKEKSAAFENRINELSNSSVASNLEISHTNIRMKDRTQDFINYLEFHKSKIDKTLENHDELISELARDADKSAFKFDKMSSDLNRIYDISLSKKDFYEKESCLKKDLSSLTENHRSVASLAKTLDSRLTDHDRLKEEMAKSIESLGFLNSGLSKDLLVLSKSQDQLNQQISSMVDKKLEQFASSISKQMEDLSVKLVPQGVSLNEIKSDFLKRIDDFRIDVNNAAMKATNNDKHIAVIEKKIENLSLLLKKYELNQ